MRYRVKITVTVDEINKIGLGDPVLHVSQTDTVEEMGDLRVETLSEAVAQTRFALFKLRTGGDIPDETL